MLDKEREGTVEEGRVRSAFEDLSLSLFLSFARSLINIAWTEKVAYLGVVKGHDLLGDERLESLMKGGDEEGIWKVQLRDLGEGRWNGLTS